MIAKPDLDITRSSVFFGSLAPPVFDAIAAKSRIAVLDEGQSLFERGEPANAIFAVLQGLMKLTINKRDGSEVVVETFHAGTSFAEALAFSNDPYPVSGIALVKSRILVAPSKVVRNAIRDNPDAFGPMLSATYAHLHRLVRQIDELKSNSGLERLGHYILARASGIEAAGDIEIPYEKQVLASLLGMQPETLSRAFRRLRDHGVTLEGRRIRLDDDQALRRLLGAD